MQKCYIFIPSALNRSAMLKINGVWPKDRPIIPNGFLIHINKRKIPCPSLICKFPPTPYEVALEETVIRVMGEMPWLFII